MKMVVFASLALIGVTGCSRNEVVPSDMVPHVVAPSQTAAGAYLVEVGGCHDCHTPGWAETGGNGIAQDQYLTGVPVGFSGPWGTSYAANLRISVQASTADEWADMMLTRQGLPPMPWFTLNHMSREDLMAIHAYISSLGEGGGDIPTAVPAGSAPATPYIWFVPVGPETHPAYQPAAEEGSDQELQEGGANGEAEQQLGGNPDGD